MLDQRCLFQFFFLFEIQDKIKRHNPFVMRACKREPEFLSAVCACKRNFYGVSIFNKTVFGVAKNDSDMNSVFFLLFSQNEIIIRLNVTRVIVGACAWR